jgi:DNA-binding NtrC family response regulator
VRLIAATNKSTEEAIKKGQFREDLYYRLNIITINLPSLRERKSDIPELVNYFLENYNSESNKNFKGIDKQALKTLSDYSWPGNVRQLENCIRRAAVLAKSEIITSQDLQLEVTGTNILSQTEEQDEKALEKILDNIINGSSEMQLLPKVEKLLITKALKKCKGNQVKAAKILGINRNTLRNRMQKHSISL